MYAFLNASAGESPGKPSRVTLNLVELSRIAAPTLFIHSGRPLSAILP
jgi:hypothetical protein